MSNIDELFERAAALPANERADFLASLSDSDREAIQRLLQAEASLEDKREFLDAGAETAATLPPRSVPDQEATLPPREDVENAQTLVGHVSQQSGTTQPLDKVRYFGEYELLREIARGGMGVVFEARQTNLNRIVALKMILSGNLAGSVEIQRFRLEAEAAAQLDHPGIVPIFEIGEHDGQNYFSMGFVDGHSLQDRVHDGPLEPKAAAKLMIEIAEAIAYAHDKGVIHRDLKPANVLLDQDGQPRITDFGLAKQIKEDSNLTNTGAVMGTPGFMPPEQASGDSDNIGPLVDVYSLGALLYCMTTGRPPFQAASSIDTLMQVMEQEPIPPQQLNTAIDSDLQTITLKCLEKKPERRYASARALVDELNRYVEGEPIHARPIGRIERGWRWCRRKPAAATAIVCYSLLVLVLSIGGPLVAMQQSKFAREQAELKTEADEAREDAEKRRSEAEAASREVAKQKKRVEGLFYATQVSLAHQEWLDGNPARARQLLANCPEEKRNWEWNYLDGLTRAEDQAIFAHTIPISIEFTPNGEQLVTRGLTDSRLSFWDVETGLSSKSIAIPNLTGVSVVNDTHVIVTSRDIVTYARVAGGERKNFGGFESLAGGGRVHDNGQKIACAFGDGSVVVYEMETGKEIHRMPGDPKKSDIAPVFSPDATLIAGVSNNRVRVWNIQTGEEILTIAGHAAAIAGESMSVTKPWCVAFSPDGKTLASGGQGGELFLTDVATGKRIREIRSHDAGMTSLDFSADGQRIVTGSKDRTARVFDVSNGYELLVIRGHESSVIDVAFAPNGKRIASSSRDGSVRIWSVDRQLAVADEVRENLDGAPHRGHKIGLESTVLYGQLGMVYDVRISPNNKYVATSAVGILDQGDNEIRVWSLADSTKHAGFPADGYLHTLEYSSDSRFLLVGSGGAGDLDHAGSVTVWDMETKEKALKIEGPTCMFIRPVLNPANDTLAVLYGNTNYSHLQLYSFPEGKLLHDEEIVGARLSGLAYSKSGDRLFTSTHPGGGKIQVWDSQTGEELDSFIAHGSGVFTIAVSQEDLLATANVDGTIGIWDWKQKKQIGLLKGHGVYAVDICFSPDGKRLLSSSEDETVKVWDLETYSELLTFRDHKSQALGADWSADGTTLATTARDGTLILRQLQRSGIPETDGAEWITVFDDDFEREELGANWGADATVWKIEDGRLVATLQPIAVNGSSFAGSFAALVSVDLPRTVMIEADVELRQPMLAQFVLGNRQTQQYIAPFIASTTQPYGYIGSAIQVARAKGADTNVLRSQKGTRLDVGKTYRLKVVRDEDELWFSLNGALLSEARVPTIETDQLSLSGCWGKVGDQIEFDNVVVRIPKPSQSESEIRQQVNAWLTRYIAPELVENRIRSEYSERPVAQRSALAFLRGLNASESFSSSKLLSAIESVANNPNATADAYKVAAEQADLYMARQRDEWWRWSKLALAFLRDGQKERALELFDKTAARCEKVDRHPLPLVLAGRALTLHAMQQQDAAVQTHADLQDLMLTDWRAEGLADLKKELEEKVPLPNNPLRDELLKKICASRQAFYDKGDANQELADFADDVEVSQGRSAEPDTYDRTFDREGFHKLESIYSTSYPLARVQIIWDQVEFGQDGETASITLVESMKFTRLDGKKTMLFRFGLRYQFEKRSDQWRITQHRYWPIDQYFGNNWADRDAAYWQRLDKRIETLKSSDDKLPLAATFLDASRFPEALTAAQAVGEDESRSAIDRAKALAIVGESAIGIGRFEEGISALESARVLHPAVQMPWFFTRQKGVYASDQTMFSIDFSPSSDLMATAQNTGTVTAWDVAARESLRSVTAHSTLAADLAFFDNGKKLVTAGFDRLLNIYDMTNGARLKQYTGHRGQIFRLESHPTQEEIVVTASADVTAKVWNLKTQREVISLAGHSHWVMSAAFSPDGTKIATGSRDETIRIWDAESGRELKNFTAHANGVWRVDWTPDGKRLVSAGHDHMVRVWETESWKELAELQGHQNVLEAVRVSPDGTLAASADIDGVIYIWDLAELKPLAVVSHPAAVFDLVFHDGDLFSASGDGTVRQWDINFLRSPLTESLDAAE